MEVTIRNVDKKVWYEFKAAAAKNQLKLGEASSIALYKWTCEQSRKKKSTEKSFFDLEPIEFIGDDVETLSTRVDEVLYR